MAGGIGRILTHNRASKERMLVERVIADSIYHDLGLWRAEAHGVSYLRPRVVFAWFAT